ncbi:MAG: hypothetical protein FWC01_07305 [Treponema sp.]|nr:hypothetical protein [Treponema sp.]MCL2237646.1 hypothetical protein [Treponema sp.]
MKNKILILLSFAFITLCAGCGSLFIKSVPFSFADNDSNPAKLTFVGSGKTGVRLVDFEGRGITTPLQGTRWESAVRFPAERPLDLRVIVYWDEDRPGDRRRGIFKCPPLEAGKEYKLWFRGNYRNGGWLTLTYASAQDYSSQVLYEQIILPLPQ